MRARAHSKDAVVPLQRAEGADVDQREAETEWIFCAQRAEGVAAVLDTDAAAVPVVIALRAAALDESLVGVHRSREGGTEALLVGMPVADQAMVLAEAIGSGGQARREQLAGNAKECMTSVKEELTDAVVEVEGAGIQALRYWIVVRVPANPGCGAGVYEQTRDDRREVPRRCEKSDAGQVFRSRKDIPLAYEERATEAA